MPEPELWSNGESALRTAVTLPAEVPGELLDQMEVLVLEGGDGERSERCLGLLTDLRRLSMPTAPRREIERTPPPASQDDEGHPELMLRLLELYHPCLWLEGRRLVMMDLDPNCFDPDWIVDDIL